jgi:hypothetical protein
MNNSPKYLTSFVTHFCWIQRNGWGAPNMYGISGRTYVVITWSIVTLVISYSAWKYHLCRWNRSQWPRGLGLNYLRPLERWDRGFESHLRHGCLCAFCVLSCVCLGQGVLPTVWKIKKLKSGQGPTKSCGVINRFADEIFLLPRYFITVTKLKTPWPLVRKRTIPPERPPLVGEVSANFCG